MTQQIRKDVTFDELMDIVDKQRDQVAYFTKLLDQWDMVDCSHSYEDIEDMLEEVTEIFMENVDLVAGIVTRRIFAACGLRVVE